MKDINGYEGLYGITSCGRVWSHKRKKFLKPRVDKDGYLRVGLYKDGEIKFFLVHRLVGLAYIPQVEGLDEINHKDEIKAHNWACNLEWCDHAYNVNYGTRNERASASMRDNCNRKKGIYSPELNEAFWSVSEASERYGLDQGTLSKCINGKRKSCGRHPITGEKLTWQLVS